MRKPSSDVRKLTLLANGEEVDFHLFPIREDVDLIIDDSSSSTKITMYEMPSKIADSNWIMLCGNEVIANSATWILNIEEQLISEVEIRARSIPVGNDLWPHDHIYMPNSGVERYKDSSFATRKLLDSLTSQMWVNKARSDYSKIGSKRLDTFQLNELHVDRFVGMRHGKDRVRRRVSRQFLNLGTTSRFVCFAVMDPEYVDKFVPDAYFPDYLDKLLGALNRSLEMLFVPISARQGSRFSSCRYLSTHILHCEYGYAGDFCAIIGSDDDDD